MPSRPPSFYESDEVREKRQKLIAHQKVVKRVSHVFFGLMFFVPIACGGTLIGMLAKDSGIPNTRRLIAMQKLTGEPSLKLGDPGSEALVKGRVADCKCIKDKPVEFWLKTPTSRIKVEAGYLAGEGGYPIRSRGVLAKGIVVNKDDPPTLNASFVTAADTGQAYTSELKRELRVVGLVSLFVVLQVSIWCIVVWKVWRYTLAVLTPALTKELAALEAPIGDRAQE